MREPSELEWLGFELAVVRYFFGHASHAAILTQLVRRSGLTCRADCLGQIASVCEDSVPVYVSQLRVHLRDAGFGARIENIKGCGYRLSETGAREIWSRIARTVEGVAELAA